MGLMFSQEDQELFPYEVVSHISVKGRRTTDTWLNLHIPDSGDHGLTEDWLWISNGHAMTHQMVYRFKHEHHAAWFALTWT